MRKLKPDKPKEKLNKKSSGGFGHLLMNLIFISIAVASLLYAYHTAVKLKELIEQEQRDKEEAVADFDSFASMENLLSTLDQKESYSRLEVAQILEIAKDEYTTAGRNDILDGLRQRIEASGSTLDSLRDLYRDYIVMSNQKGYLFKPINPNIPANPYPADNFLQISDGTLSYGDENGTTPSKGIDVSSHQGKIDWEKVAATGIDFSIVRVGYRGYSEGSLLEDTEGRANLEGSIANGLHTGAYIFTQAVNMDEIDEEADFVLGIIRDYKIDGPVVLDVEEVEGGGRTADLPPKERTALIRRFCERISEAGYTPMIYGNLRSTTLMFDLEALKDYPMWYAYYSFPIYYPYDYHILQYSSTGKVDGIKTDVDLNLCFKNWW